MELVEVRCRSGPTPGRGTGTSTWSARWVRRRSDLPRRAGMAKKRPLGSA